MAAEELGYTEKRWDRDRHVFSDDLFWAQLTARQRWAAKVIGYSEITWDDATRAGSGACLPPADASRPCRKAAVVDRKIAAWTEMEGCWGLWGGVDRGGLAARVVAQKERGRVD